MKKHAPYILLSFLLHVLGVLCLVYSPVKKQQPKKLAFKEQFVTLPTSVIKTPPSQTQQTPSSPKPSQPTPQPKPQPIKETPQPKKNPSSQPEIIKKTTPEPNQEARKKALEKQAKLKAIADLASSLSKHLEESDTHLAELSHHQSTASLPSSSALTQALASTQEEELCQLLREYIVLSSSKEVRVRLTLSPQGEVQDCTILSSISEAENQLILMRMNEIPFKKFLDKYKISKNITFHIKLLSSS